MSEVAFARVVSCSNEDVGYASSNLLKPSIASGKWRCKAGEKSASVVLQLDRSVKIGQIDIGNNGSAFVEILVGKSANSVNDFSVIVPSSSFMSPAECKTQSGGNSCRVRMFSTDKFMKPVGDETWDLLKVVCTQPFNKTVPFGISFVKVYASSELQATKTIETSDNLLAEKTGGLTVKTPNASKESGDKKLERKSSPKATESHDSSARRSEVSVAEVKRSGKRSSSSEIESSPNRKRTKGGDSSSQKSRPLSGVVFVLSGFQNPERSNLRNKAIELGGRYEADWTDGVCTHLVCAFANTPKFNQVKRKGKIVSKKWIEDCFNEKALLDWRKYDMCSKDDSQVYSKTPDPKKVVPSATALRTTNISADDLVGQLPDIFQSRNFFIHPLVEPKLKDNLERLITTYAGSLMDKVSSATDFVIAEDGTDISELETDHPEVVIVRPDWILACQRKQKLLPHDQFAVSSS